MRHNAPQDIFVDFALLTLHSDDLILELILMFFWQIPLLDGLEIDAFGVANYKLDTAAVPKISYALEN